MLHPAPIQAPSQGSSAAGKKLGTTHSWFKTLNKHLSSIERQIRVTDGLVSKPDVCTQIIFDRLGIRKRTGFECFTGV